MDNMENCFWVDDHGSSEFGAWLVGDYSIGAPTISQDYVVASTGSRITPGGTRYGLRSITLPVDIYGSSPEDAADKRSHLTAALAKRTVELALPDGGLYTCLLTDGGKMEENDRDGKIISCTYALVGYKHGALETLVVSGAASSVSFWAAGTAEQMECRITATVGSYVNDKVYVPYPNKSATTGCRFPKTAVKSGDTIVIDGIEKGVYVNGSNGFYLLDTIAGGWPKVKPGENTLTIAQPSSGAAFSQIAIEYYPIYI